MTNQPAETDTTTGGGPQERLADFVATGPIDANLRSSSGDINVTVSDDQAIHVRLTATGAQARAKLDAAVIDFDAATNTLTVHTRTKAMSRQKFFEFARHDVNIFASVPRASTLIVNTASGDLHASGEYRDVKAASASGDLVIDSCTGSFQANVASGDVKVGDVGGRVDVNAVSGDVTVGPAIADVKVSMVSGDMDLIVTAPLDAKVHAVSGDVLIRFAPGLALDVNAKTISGKIDSQFALNGVSGGGDANEEGVTLNASTVSGDIRLTRI